MKFLVLALFVAAAVAAPFPEDSNNDAVEVIVNGVPEGTPLELGGIVDMHLNEHVKGELASSSNLLHPYTAVGIAEAAAAAAAEEIAPSPIQIVGQPDSEYHIMPEAIVLPEPVEVAKPDVPAPIVLPNPVAPVAIPESVVIPEPVAPEVVPSPIVMPNPVSPVQLPEAVVIPEPIAPESVPSPIVMPTPVAPVQVPESVVIPEPVVPEVAPSPIVMPSPVAPEVAPEAESIALPAPVPPMVIPEAPEVVPEPAAQGPNEIFNNGLVQVQVNAPEEAGVFTTLQNWFSLVVNYISNGIQTTQQIV